ncbi:hypothetical protein E0W72_03620 [Flavobacterium arcticum]|nr:hypothetical protein [Flavobacterium arcticum]KAF2512324.1 hypothetical protein E0W72_03620 [Flavobacterium arcticum]
MKKIKIIIALILIAFISIWLFVSNNRIGKEEKRIYCEAGILYIQSMKLDGYNPSDVNRAKVYALERKTGKIVDSTTILLDGYNESKNQHLTYNLYSLEKPLSTATDWKFFLNDSSEILVSDIKTRINEYRNMFGTTDICDIVEWRVNGKLYSIETEGCFITNEN